MHEAANSGLEISKEICNSKIVHKNGQNQSSENVQRANDQSVFLKVRRAVGKCVCWKLGKHCNWRGSLQNTQLRDQLPEVANLITRRVPTRIRKVTKRPTKLQGRKVVRALFTDCASLSKFCGAEKLFVRISKGRVRFAAPWGRFTISFGETQFQQYSALFYGNGWKPLFCNIDTTQGPSNIVGYTGVKVVIIMGFILETVWCSGNKFFKILLILINLYFF